MHIEITGVIGFDTTASQVREQLKSSSGDLDVTIDSLGGSVTDGIAIYNAFQKYKKDNPNAQINATITGPVASMGTYIASNPAIDLLSAYDNTAYMIHNAWSFAMGDHNVFYKEAALLESFSGMLRASYETRTGISAEELQAMMDAETWLFGEEMQKLGFVDEIIKSEQGDKPDTEDEMANFKKQIASKYQTRIAAQSLDNALEKAISEDIKSNKKTKNEVNEMDKEEILKAEEKTLKAERQRVSEIYALKDKYKDSAVIDAVSDIVDEAVKSGITKAEALTDIQVKLASGNNLAAAESAGDIQAVGSDTVSGESEKEKIEAEDF